jgi:hypothetical protein
MNPSQMVELVPEQDYYDVVYGTWQREGNPGSVTWAGVNWMVVNRNGDTIFINGGILSQMDMAMSGNSFGPREVAVPTTEIQYDLPKKPARSRKTAE